MKIIMSDLKKLCMDTFKEQDWKTVYDFYTKKLQVDCTTKNPEYNKKSGVKRNVYIPSNERRLKHLRTLITDYGADNILKAITKFLDKERTGELSSLSMSYFGGFVKNIALQEDKPQRTKTAPNFKHTFKDNAITVTTGIKPRKIAELPDKSIGSDGLSAWYYNCECGEGFTYKQHGTCPRCNKKLDWSDTI